MMTLEELTSWRVAAIEGKLPEPVRSSRWQPLRAGVVNLWEYDTAEVWYADGRMQLQGANESGKSTLMTLTTLLLLAGEITSHNIDTLVRTTSASAITSNLPTTPWTGGTPAPRRTAAGPGLNSARAPKPIGKQTSSPCCSSPRLAVPTRT
jgi:hypothetical protein